MFGKVLTRLVVVLALLAGGFADLASPARAHASTEGSLDESFNPGTGAASTVHAVAVDAAGKILVGGAFRSFGGVSGRNRIVRLNADGTLDTTFDPGTGAASAVNVVVVDAAGKILVGGAFTSFGGVSGRNRIVRLNADGSLDTSFDPGTGANNTVNVVAVDAAGKILIGGTFTSFNGDSKWNRIVRLNADGSLDTSFDPGTGANGVVMSIVPLLDDRILIGGQFTTYDGTSRSGIARLNADGSLDETFDPGAGAASTVHVNAMAVARDGKILIGGQFTRYDGIVRNRIARVHATPVLAPGSPTQVRAFAGNAAASVQWTAPQQSFVTGYTVTASPGGATCTTTGELNCVVSGLTNGTEYIFTVVAKNAVGSSPASAPSAPATPSGRETADPGTVTGVVFDDYDVSGVRRTDEPGVAGVVVRAFDSAGALVGFAITADDGSYTLNVFAPATSMVRVEFTLPDGYEPSFTAPDRGAGGTVRFVELGTAGATEVDLGIQDPLLYCNDNPLVACTLVDRTQDPDDPFGSIRTFNWDNTGTDTILADNLETGSVWGLGWQRQTGTLLAAPTLRRNTKVYESPEGTPRLGQLFLSTTEVGSLATYVDVEALGVPLGTIPNFATRMTAVDNTVDGFYPAGTWDLTAKVGIGDIDFSYDGEMLWFVNLHDRSLYRLDVGVPLRPAAALTSDHVTRYDIPDPGCTNGVYRPWAVAPRPDGSVFVGGVCTGENGGVRDDLEAVVYRLDPTWSSFGDAPVLRFSLDYTTKESAHYGDSNLQTTTSRWAAWWEQPNNNTSGGRWAPNAASGPMPILADIEFSPDGHMTLGFLDRMAQRAQTFNQRGSRLPGTTVTDWFWTSSGDVLRACTADEQTWQIEPIYTTTLATAGCVIDGVTYFTQSLQPGRFGSAYREFYNDNVVGYRAPQTFGDFTFPAQGHNEGALGGLATYPRATEIVGTIYDTNGEIFTGGVRWWSNETGLGRGGTNLRTGDRQLVREASAGGESFGKAGGVGDIEVLCDPAPVQIGDRVWFDADGDGIQDPGEPGIAGVTVRLYAITEDADGATVSSLVATAVTDADGYYRFSSTVTNNVEGDGLPDGGNLRPFTAYEIRLDEPDDYEAGGPLEGLRLTLEGQTSGDADVLDDAIDSDAILSGGSTFGVNQFPVVEVEPLSPGQNDHSFDIGFNDGQVRVGGQVWFDTNDDGSQDAGEPGVAGVTVTLSRVDGQPLVDANGDPVTDANGATVSALTMVTDANGNYLFTNLGPGAYRVDIVPPPGYSSTATFLTSGELDEGDQALTLDFGLFAPSVSVGDRVWFDLDGDGIQDPGEPGIAGVTLTLTDVTGSPVTDVFGNEVSPTTTDANGNYLFENLPPGEYRVTASTPEGLTATTAVQQTSDNLSTDGASDLTLDFGFRIPSVSVGDRVWYDEDRDGFQDPDERGIAGVELTLKVKTGEDDDGDTVWGPAVDVFGNSVTTTTTDANGDYLFDFLPPGEYKVTVTPPAGLSPTEINATTGAVTSVNLTADGQSDLTLDFGFWAPQVSVGGLVWFDTNQDGVSVSGEPGLAGVTLTLTNLDGSAVFDVFGNPVTTTTTDANGNYLFENLPPGEYKVTVMPPAGLSPTEMNATTGAATSVNLTADGQSDLTLDFGFWTPPAIVGGRVWYDLDRDGLIGVNEPGIAGVTVSITTLSGSEVTDVNGHPVTTTTTDANGNYLFTDLPFDEQYVVTVTEPDGSVRTLLRAGTDLVVSSAHESATSGAMTLGDSATASNLLDQTLNFGFVPPVSVGDRVWFDTNNDGIQDAGEPGIAGVTVTLSRVDGQPVVDVNGNPVTTTTMVTDANGNYLFENLAPAEYRVTVTPPAGLTPSPAGVGSDPEVDSSTGSATSTTTAAGVSDMTLDFGFHRPSVSVGDFVWFDVDGDGVQDPGEPGIEGVTVTITNLDGSAVFDVFGNAVTTTTTDANGNYLFENLPVGEYRVTASTPSGMLATTAVHQTSAELTTNGASDLTLDFGFRLPAVSVGDLVWFDANNDGIQDPDEPGLAGVELDLKVWNGSAWVGAVDVLGNPVTTTTTNANGNYVFTNLPTGQYRVSVVTPPGGFVATLPEQGDNRAIDSSTDFAVSAVLTADGASDRTLDFGFYLPSVSVGDLVWFDTNNDGIQDPGEPGIEGVTLTLTDVTGSPVTDVFGNPVTSTTTDADGRYLFTALPPGEYKVTVTPPPGMDPSPAGMGSDPAVDSSTGSATSAVLAGGESDLTLDFGFYAPSVSVGDFVWFDTNNDGIQDPGEPGIEGVTLTLTDVTGSPVTDVFGNEVTTTTTDANGDYLFGFLPPGEYTVTVTPPAGLSPTEINATTGAATSVNLTADGQSDLTLDFGFWAPQVSVGGLVWFDTNQDGVSVSGEPGLAGVTLTLTNLDGSAVFDVFGNPVTTTTTDAKGNYLFENLPPGEYEVTVMPPAGLSPTEMNATTGAATSVNLTTNGDSDLTLDFGFYAPSVSVGDFVWFDTNNDGIQDPGEPGIEGVTLTLTDVTGSPVTDVFGNPVTSTTTDANGKYLFENLPPGEYTVTVTPPAGMVASPANVGSDRSVDSSTGTATSRDLTTNGDSDLTLDFGFSRPVPAALPSSGPSSSVPSVSVGDLVWFDTNNDGIQDVGEPGIEGVTVTIAFVDGSPVFDVFGNPVTSMVTDANGNYLFENLPLGQYTVTVTPPAGMVASPANVGSDRSVDSSTGTATSGDLTTNGDSDLTLDFGFSRPVASVAGNVWLDADRDAARGESEVVLVGVEVMLLNPDGSPVLDVFGRPVGSTFTDVSGNYVFDFLVPGEYQVVFMVSPAVAATNVPGAHPRGSVVLDVVVGSGEHLRGVDVGVAVAQLPATGSGSTLPVVALWLIVIGIVSETLRRRQITRTRPNLG